MDGRGRLLDNIFIERLWRNVKYEEVYLKAYDSISEARREPGCYFEFYNHRRRHQSLDYRAPEEVYWAIKCRWQYDLRIAITCPKKPGQLC